MAARLMQQSSMCTTVVGPMAPPMMHSGHFTYYALGNSLEFSPIDDILAVVIELQDETEYDPASGNVVGRIGRWTQLVDNFERFCASRHLVLHSGRQLRRTAWQRFTYLHLNCRCEIANTSTKPAGRQKGDKAQTHEVSTHRCVQLLDADCTRIDNETFLLSSMKLLTHVPSDAEQYSRMTQEEEKARIIFFTSQRSKTILKDLLPKMALYYSQEDPEKVQREVKDLVRRCLFAAAESRKKKYKTTKKSELGTWTSGTGAGAGVAAMLLRHPASILDATRSSSSIDFFGNLIDFFGCSYYSSVAIEFSRHDADSTIDFLRHGAKSTIDFYSHGVGSTVKFFGWVAYGSVVIDDFREARRGALRLQIDAGDAVGHQPVAALPGRATRGVYRGPPLPIRRGDAAFGIEDQVCITRPSSTTLFSPVLSEMFWRTVSAPVHIHTLLVGQSPPPPNPLTPRPPHSLSPSSAFDPLCSPIAALHQMAIKEPQPSGRAGIHSFGSKYLIPDGRGGATTRAAILLTGLTILPSLENLTTWQKLRKFSGHHLHRRDWRCKEPSGPDLLRYNPFTVCLFFPEVLLKFSFQDIPPPRYKLSLTNSEKLHQRTTPHIHHVKAAACLCICNLQCPLVQSEWDVTKLRHDGRWRSDQRMHSAAFWRAETHTDLHDFKKQRRNERAGETGDPRLNPPSPSSGTIPTCENPGTTPPGIEPDSPKQEKSYLIGVPGFYTETRADSDTSIQPTYCAAILSDTDEKLPYSATDKQNEQTVLERRAGSKPSKCGSVRSGGPRSDLTSLASPNPRLSSFPGCFQGNPPSPAPFSFAILFSPPLTAVLSDKHRSFHFLYEFLPLFAAVIVYRPLSCIDKARMKIFISFPASSRVGMDDAASPQCTIPAGLQALRMSSAENTFDKILLFCRFSYKTERPKASPSQHGQNTTMEIALCYNFELRENDMGNYEPTTNSHDTMPSCIQFVAGRRLVRMSTFHPAKHYVNTKPSSSNANNAYFSERLL
ncbi:hypothetical protein PR048_004954 [Dryococelus australis]|uniref:Fungal lipase-like domain-containing protein n=1 Tax=Dryococelus australis TaxID=614101 RepID=A0ABQ9I7X0_9NEOP|nr:hypothetical protein PR048_004954 [Dryococelus australis]